LVAVGGIEDVRLAMEETSSELLQLAGVCLDAEVYSDEDPGQAVIRRSQLLDSALYREGVAPVFMTLNCQEQLRVGNRFMERLAAQAQPDDPTLGMRKVVSVVEAGGRLADIGLDDVACLLHAALPSDGARVRDVIVGLVPRLEMST